MMAGVYIQEKDIKFWTSIVFENHYPYRNLGNYPLPEGGQAYENVSKPRKDKKWGKISTTNYWWGQYDFLRIIWTHTYLGKTSLRNM